MKIKQGRERGRDRRMNEQRKESMNQSLSYKGIGEPMSINYTIN